MCMWGMGYQPRAGEATWGVWDVVLEDDVENKLYQKDN